MAMANFNDTHLNHNLKYLYVQKSLVTAYFHLPIVVLFWQDLGLHMFEIMVLQAAFSIATVLLELPSGIFADFFGRQRALVIASFCNVVGIGLYCFADGFVDLLIAELVLAGFVAMQSGADSAFLYDNLKAVDRQDQYAKILGNLIFVSTIVLGVVNVVGGFVGAENLKLALFLSLPFVSAALLASTRLIEPPSDNSIKTVSLKQQLHSIAGAIHFDKALKWLIIYAGVVLTFNQAVLWLYQPYFQLTGIEVMYFGVIFALFQFTAAFAGKYYYLAKDFLGEKSLLLSLTLMSCLSSILLGHMIYMFSFTIIFFHQIVRGFYKIIFSDIINRRVDSNIRASVLSVQNLVGRILTALVMPVFGWYADLYSIEQTFALIGITGLCCSLPVFWLLSRHEITA